MCGVRLHFENGVQCPLSIWNLDFSYFVPGTKSRLYYCTAFFRVLKRTVNNFASEAEMESNLHDTFAGKLQHSEAGFLNHSWGRRVKRS